MVQAIISISDEANKVLNIVKAKYDLRGKSEAIDFVARQYGQEILEPCLRPEYIEKADKIIGKKAIRVGSIKNLRGRYEK